MPDPPPVTASGTPRRGTITIGRIMIGIAVLAVTLAGSLGHLGVFFGVLSMVVYLYAATWFFLVAIPELYLVLKARARGLAPDELERILVIGDQPEEITYLDNSPGAQADQEVWHLTDGPESAADRFAREQRIAGPVHEPAEPAERGETAPDEAFAGGPSDLPTEKQDLHEQRSQGTGAAGSEGSVAEPDTRSSGQ